MAYKWSTEEIELLIKIFEYKSKKFILEKFPDKSDQCIFRKAKKLGLKRNPIIIGQDIAKGSKKHENRWKKSEITILKRIYFKGTRKFIESKIPKRKWSAITIMANRLSLKRNHSIWLKDRGLTLAKKGTGKWWHFKDIKLLKKIYKNNSKKYILSKFNKSWLSICNKAREMGLHRNPLLINKDRKIRSKRKDSCSEEEKKLLLEIYEHNTIAVIMKKFAKFNRTKNSIRRFAGQLGLKRDPKIIKQEIIENGKRAFLFREDLWTIKEEKLLKKIYKNSSYNLIIKKFPNRTWKSIREKAIHLGLCRDINIINQERNKSNKITMLKRYGVKYSTQLESMKEKSRLSAYRQGTQKISKQQLYLGNLLKGKINYPVGSYSADVLLENNIICEYNGGGHKLQVKLKNISEKDFIRQEIKRDLFLESKGYSIIKIISESDLLPEDGILLKMINEGKKYLRKGHSWLIYDIDQKKIIGKTFQNNYSFKKLRKIS